MATGSRGYKNQVRLRGLTKYQRNIKDFETRVGGFRLYSCGFNRPANLKLTPMGIPCPYRLVYLTEKRYRNKAF